MRHEELVHEEEKNGYSIKLYLAEEDMDPRDSFDVGADGVCADIRAGRLMWFCAHVVAEKDGYEGDDYLGGCCYESVAEFIKPGDYYSDMVDVAIEQCANERASQEQKRAFC